MQYILEPNSVVYFGCVGNDENAKRLQEANEKVGLKVYYVRGNFMVQDGQERLLSLIV